MDPLRDSPLSMLDTGGALSLVLDRVDEDDALCAALACTTFRDALFAQRRHAVRPAADEPHAGKRLVTSVAGAGASAARLAWVKTLGPQAPGWVCVWDASTCAFLAHVGALQALQWARANGCEWDSETCSSAAAEGHLEVLQWARANGCEWDSETSSAESHFEVYRWAQGR